MRPASSIFAKILFWFFLNMAIMMAVILMFFAFQSQMNLQEIIGWYPSDDRFRIAERLISHDLGRTPKEQWESILQRYSNLFKVDFVILLYGGDFVCSKKLSVPNEVIMKAATLASSGPNRTVFSDSRRLNRKTRFMIHAKNTNRYWAGIRIPSRYETFHDQRPIVLLAVSDSITGHSFFFDPLPWMVISAIVLLLPILLWIPLLRNITRPIARITAATEEIARGRFDLEIDQSRGDEIGRLAKAINTMNVRLHGFVKGQKRFLSDVAHELGSPLSRIQMGLGILEQKAGPEIRQRVEDVKEDAAHLSDLVNEFLSFSRAGMYPEKVLLKPIALLPIVNQAVDRESVQGTKIIIQVAPDILVQGDPGLLTRAICNLIRNAVRFGGAYGPVLVVAEQKANAVLFRVADSGPGVSGDHMAKLFEPFYRPEASRDRGTGGVGLGLAIVKACVETCNGSVTAENQVPKGFSVIVTLRRPQ